MMVQVMPVDSANQIHNSREFTMSLRNEQGWFGIYREGPDGVPGVIDLPITSGGTSFLASKFRFQQS
jgi:hypothetical protein